MTSFLFFCGKSFLFLLYKYVYYLSMLQCFKAFRGCFCWYFFFIFWKLFPLSNLWTRSKAAPYCFGHVPHFVFVFPQHDVITLNMIFSYQHYDVTPLVHNSYCAMDDILNKSNFRSYEIFYIWVDNKVFGSLLFQDLVSCRNTWRIPEATWVQSWHVIWRITVFMMPGNCQLNSHRKMVSILIGGNCLCSNQIQIYGIRVLGLR